MKERFLFLACMLSASLSHLDIITINNEHNVNIEDMRKTSLYPIMPAMKLPKGAPRNKPINCIDWKIPNARPLTFDSKRSKMVAELLLKNRLVPIPQIIRPNISK